MKLFVARVLAVLLIAAGTVMMLPFERAAATTVNIAVSGTIGQYWFCNSSYQNGVCPTTIQVGDTVNWVFNGDIYSAHTTTECGANCNMPTGTPLWDSSPPMTVANFSYTFNSPGTYYYQCSVHLNAMRGVITVTAPVGGETQLPGLSPRALEQPTGPVGHVGTWIGLAGIGAGMFILTSGAWLTQRRLAARHEQR